MGRNQRIRGRGGGRGRGSGRGNPDRFGNGPRNNNLQDYMYYPATSAKQAFDYETTTKFIINRIKMTYDHGADITRALATLTEYDFSNHKPTLQFSTNTDATQKIRENFEHGVMFEAEYKVFTNRKKTYESNRIKVYYLIWEQCVEAMQSKLRARQDFTSTILDNPIELLKALSSTLPSPTKKIATRCRLFMTL